MQLQTLGHAGMLLRDDAAAPVLLTDPWILGSCYWRSWWLLHYPEPELLEELRHARYCFVTHEHPDHFSMPGIRALGTGVEFLAPELPEEHIAAYLSSKGYRASVVPAFHWRTLHPGVRILSIPLANDDSVLLVDTPSAVIVNLNDAKPGAGQVRQLRRSLDRIAPGKRRVLLSSYSPASIVNSFVRNAERVSLRQKADYVRYVCDNCRLLAIDDFMPFASQVIFRRSDSAWANAFKVTFADLQAAWDAGATRLLPPYARLSLGDGAYTFVPPDRYRQEAEDAARKVEAQEALDRAAALDDDDIERLRRKLGASRWLLAPLFPRGIGFALERESLRYDPWRGTLSRGVAGGDFTLTVPAQAFKDALTYGHFGDMGTTMFTMVMLNSTIHPRRVYLFFMVMSLHDYGHLTGIGSWLRWVRYAVRTRTWRIPAPGAL